MRGTWRVSIDLVAAGTSGLAASNQTPAIYQGLFPAQRFETAGAPGKNWVEVEVRQTNQVVQWYLDDTLVAQRTNGSAFTAGAIMIGFMDTFNSIASPGRDAFVLFDNVRVEDLASQAKFLSATISSDGVAHLTFSAVPDHVYALEASTNLTDWQSIATSLVSSGGPISFSDGAAVNSQPAVLSRQTNERPEKEGPAQGMCSRLLPSRPFPNDSVRLSPSRLLY